MKNIITMMLVAVLVSICLPAFGEEYLPQSVAAPAEDYTPAPVVSVDPLCSIRQSIRNIWSKTKSNSSEIAELKKEVKEIKGQIKDHETRLNKDEKFTKDLEDSYRKTVKVVNNHRELIDGLKESAVTVAGLIWDFFITVAFLFFVFGIIYLITKKRYAKTCPTEDKK